MSSRREFLQSTAALSAGVTALSSLPAGAYAQGKDEIKVGLIGCGGRGTGAMGNAFDAKTANLKLVAMGDMFEDAIGGALKSLQNKLGSDAEKKIDVPKDRQFVGFNAFQQVIDSGVDMVIMATPPGFRPMHFEAAVKAGKNCFIEKPVAVDAPGVQQVLAAAKLADEKGLKVGVGLQRRHQTQYLEYIQRIREGEIGDIIAQRVYWNGGGVWEPRRKREECKTEMEYQLRNWYYYNWLCGDHICEQHIHNLDIGCWIKDKWPVKANGMGGREVRKDKIYGEIFDHHACEFFFDDGSVMISQCRHIKGCWNSVAEHAHGTKGIINLDSSPRNCSIEKYGAAKVPYKGKSNEPYVDEHAALHQAIAKNEKYNEAHRGAYSTMVAVLGRMCTYSGKEITWNDALNSRIALRPSAYTLDGVPPSVPNDKGEYPIAIPGVTKMV